MKHKSFQHMNCSLAQALEVVGERWTLLVLRDAFLGPRRFNQLQESLGIPRNILATRLNRLVAEGILEKQRLSNSKRFAYALTRKGLDLQPAIMALVQWGDTYKPNPNGPRLVFTERETGEPIQPVKVRSADGRALAPNQLGVVPGPGFGK